MRYFSDFRFFLPGLAILLALGACDVDKQPAVDTPIELRVMTFNIEWGGTHINFDNVVEAIRLSNADIVGIQEAEGNLQRLADELGWYADLRNYTVSKYPLIDPPGANGQYLFVEVTPGKIVALVNVHLPSDPYGPDQFRDGASPEEMLEIERAARLPYITPQLAILSRLIKQNIPVFLTGDFNAPAHTDWTPEMVGARKFLDRSFDWPVSRAISAAGLVDSWHKVHPDPLTEPGLTWWAGRPPLDIYTPGENDPQDRIDFVWYAGPAKVLSSELVGEQDAAEVSYSVMPWPSDHRAVVSGFSVIPADMPDLVTSDQRVYKLGQDVDIRYQWSGNANATIDLQDVNGNLLLTKQAVIGSGHIIVAAGDLSAGQYQIELQLPNHQPSFQRDFWVLDPAESPRVEVIGASFAPGDAIPIRWFNAPGNRNDYVAVVNPEVQTELQGEMPWVYVQSLPQGELRLDQTSMGISQPLTEGTYVIRLVKDDGYETLAESATFEVR